MEQAMYEIFDKQTISTKNGNVRHGLRVDDKDFSGFGEVYFSEVNKGCVKGWKRHSKMVVNLLPITGQFLIKIKKNFEENPVKVFFGEFDYKLLRIEPNVWFAFEGLDDKNILANVASIPHDPDEAETIEYEKIK